MLCLLSHLKGSVRPLKINYTKNKTKKDFNFFSKFIYHSSFFQFFITVSATFASLDSARDRHWVVFRLVALLPFRHACHTSFASRPLWTCPWHRPVAILSCQRPVSPGRMWCVLKIIIQKININSKYYFLIKKCLNIFLNFQCH